MIKNANFFVRADSDDTTTHMGEDIFYKHLLILELIVKIDILMLIAIWLARLKRISSSSSE